MRLQLLHCLFYPCNIILLRRVPLGQGRARISRGFTVSLSFGKGNELSQVAAHLSRHIGADRPAGMRAEGGDNVGQADAGKIVAIRIHVRD